MASLASTVLRRRKSYACILSSLVLLCLGLILFPHPVLAKPTAAVTLTVTSAADSGAGSLREALLNAAPGDTILFSQAIFPPASPATIFLVAGLPSLDVSNLTLDARNAGVILNGSGLPDSGSDCLVVENASNVTIRGLQIIGCREHAIEIRSNVSNLTIGGDRSVGTGPVGQGNRLAQNQRGIYAAGANIQGITLQGNLVGVDLAGENAAPNTASGIVIRDAVTVVVGGNTAGERNLISANGLVGLEIWNCTNLTIQDNYIGTNLSGTAALGNAGAGIQVADSSIALLKDNLISGNQSHGAAFERVDQVTAQGNIIGVDAAGNAALANARVGLLMSGTALIVGGDQPGQGNLISGNQGWTGVELNNPGITLTTIVVKGNTIGTNRAGTGAIPNAQYGLYVAGANVTLGGPTAAEGNLISGNGATGVVIESPQKIAYTATVLNNTIGTNRVGTAALPNTANGMDLKDFGQASLRNNLISGNGAQGWTALYLRGIGASNTQAILQGNYIGTDRSGAAAISNAKTGLHADLTNLIIGGTEAAEKNVFSANGGHGILIENNSTQPFSAAITGNLIGTNLTGTAGLPNTHNGIYLSGLAQVTLTGNLISSNGENGVSLVGKSSMQATLCNNKIGTDAAGSLDFGNKGNGIYALGTSLTVGDSSSGCLPNLISGNDGAGLFASSSSTLSLTMRGNKIGTDLSGQKALGQGSDGVWVQGYEVIFGGPAAAYGNLVSGNLHTGLLISDTLSATVQNNRFGTDASGTQAVPNSWSGLVLNRVQNASINQNQFSGNTNNGIALETGASNNQVYDNWIGTDPTGKTALGNKERGLSLSGGANHNYIYNNIISGNKFGIVLHESGTDYNEIYGNLIGVDASGVISLSNTATGVLINSGSYNLIGGAWSPRRNIISANGEFGILITMPGAVGNIIAGNYIGVDQSGTRARGNTIAGVALFNGTSANRIGGPSAAERNIISGNHEQGLNIGGTQNEVRNNYIGTDAAGTAALGNSKEGISLHVADIGTSGENTIIDNVISSNSSNGVTVTSNKNRIQGNKIGTDVTGKIALGNQANGIYISGSQNQVGGTGAELRNLIAANGANGLGLGIDRDEQKITIIRTATGNIIENNYIGTDLDGRLALPNQGMGVFLSGVGNRVGSQVEGLGNLISGNGHEGLALGEASLTINNLVQGNHIGVDNTGLKALPNGDSGIVIWAGVGHNIIGGDTAQAGNLVAYNRDYGIAKFQDSQNGEGVANQVANNIIHHNRNIGLRISVNTSLGNNNVYANGDDRILVPAGTLQGSSQTWSVQGGADSYFIYFNGEPKGLTIAGDASLTIQQGVKIYLDYNRTLLVEGSLTTQGTITQPVRLTGPRDTIWTGDWLGVVFASGSHGNLNFTEISFAQVGLEVGGAVSLSNSTVAGHKKGGILVNGSGTLQMQNNSLGSNFIDWGKPANYAYDIQNNTTNTIDARGTWWGSASEPIASRVIGNVDTSRRRTTESQVNDVWQAGELLVTGEHIFTISETRDLDWFRIPIMQSGTLDITLTGLPLDYDIYLFGHLGGATRYASDVGRRLLHIGRLMHLEETYTLQQSDTVARIMQIGQFSDDGKGLESGQLLRASTNPGTKPEHISFDVGNQVGWYYILVAGNNGAHHAAQSYRLKISFAGHSSGQIPYPVPEFLPKSSTSNKTTLIITNREQLEKHYGLTPTADLMAEVEAFAAQPAVNGEVIDLANCETLYPDNTSIACNDIMKQAYDAWDGAPQSVYQANVVAATIKSLLSAIRTSYPNLKYIVIIGNDHIVPHWRVLDEAPMANENSYLPVDSTGTPLGTAITQGYFLTDDYYTQYEPLAWRDRELYLPDYAIGRLVETPDQMIKMLKTFQRHSTLEINDALVTAYDFLQDQAVDIITELPGVTTHQLISNTWTTQELTSTWFAANSDFVSLNAHFSHQQALPGSLDEELTLKPGHILSGLNGSAGSLVYSVGCHTGLSVPESQPGKADNLDFVQAFMQQGISLIGNTGFGYGDVGSIGYSETLSLLFLRQLKTGASLGEALARAKRQYYQQTASASFSPYDEKVLEGVVLYGLPMQLAKFPTGLRSDEPTTSPDLSCAFKDQALAPGTSITGSDSPSARSLNCQFTPHQTTTEWGTYFDIAGGVEINMGEPIQPRFDIDVSQPEQLAHGVFFEGGRYLSYPAFNSVITKVITDTGITPPAEPDFFVPTWTPSGWDMINSVRTASGFVQRLVLVPAQYHPQTGQTGIERVFQTMNYTIYYSTSSDGFPPFIWEIKANPDPTLTKAVIEVTAFDYSGISRVAVAYNSGDKEWIIRDLASSDMELWHTELPNLPGLTFFIQVLDSAGNVAIANNKGAYYSISTSFAFLPVAHK